MDETFQLRARRLLGERHSAPLDFSMLIAALAAERAAKGTAREPGPAPEGDGPPGGDPLTEIVLAGPDWRRAACALHGCFNRAEVKRRRNDP